MKKSLKLALLFLTLTFIACGGGSSGGGGNSTPPNTGGNTTDGGNGGGGTSPTIKTTLTITNATGDENSNKNIIFKVTANPPIAESINFNYRIDFTGQTANASDFEGITAGSKTIATTDSSTTISILVRDDNIQEPAETFKIILTASTDINISSATGTIAESDPTGAKTEISISNAQANEGENITFTVTANQSIAKQVSFTYQVNFDNLITSTSANPNDLSGDSRGSRTIAANSDSTTISILIKDDDINEPAETFRIVLSNLSPSDATFTNSTAIGTIFASDPTKIRIIGAEGNEGSMLNFTVTATPPNAKQVTFKFEATVDNKATNPASISDLSGKLTGTSTIDANSTGTTISILTADDPLRENNETFMVMLSDLSPNDVTFTDHTAIGTILDNDNNATGIVTISVADAEATEDSGTIKFKVTSEFPAATGSQFTVDYEATLDNRTTDNSADADDFRATKTTATIPAGSDSTTISISLRQDTTIEPDETFRLLLTNTSSNATLDSANNSATGTILNDDLGEISDATAIIGDEKITLNWTNPKSNIFAGVVIAQTTSTDAPLNCASAPNVTIIDAQQTTSRNIASLTNNAAYSFRICARNNDSSKISNGVALNNHTPLPTIDKDGNGLIEIADATALNNIRHNLDGDGYITSSGGSANTAGCPNNVCRGYELTANIDLSNSKYSNGWTPIGSNDDGNKFTAILDGNNNRISGLRISTTDSNIGLFSILNNATISNLKLAKVKIVGNNYVGALVGRTTGTNILSNIELIGDESQSSSDAEITGTGSRVGGLVGLIHGGVISDASSSLTVRGGVVNNNLSGTGGLVGVLENNNFQNGSIQNSNSSGSVSNSGGDNSVGGLVGLNNGNISNSWASGSVSGNGNNYGGLVGRTSGNISNSWAIGNVSGNGNRYGGLVGLNNGNISNSWASGEVAGNNEVGGLVGTNGSGIYQNWASGNASGNSDVGGLVGSNNIENIFDGEIDERNYQLDDDPGGAILGGASPNSFHLASTADLASLSGASGTATTDTNWHAGFTRIVRTVNRTLFTRFCDTDGSNTIEADEQMADNSVWVMPSDLTSSSEFPAGMRNSDNVPAPTTDTAGNPVNPDTYYAIPAIRCIANTADATNDAEIYRLRKREIDRQRRNFPQPSN